MNGTSSELLFVFKLLRSSQSTDHLAHACLILDQGLRQVLNHTRPAFCPLLLFMYMCIVL